MVQASVGFQCPECTKAQPQRVVNPLRAPQGRPVVTLTLIALNVAAFVGVLATGGTISSGGGQLSSDWALTAIARDGRQLVGVAEGEWYRIFTSAFIHYGLVHLGMNMLALWVLGSQLEPLMGRVRFLLLYLVSLLCGALAVLVFNPFDVTAGASGAIYGLLAAAFLYQRSRGVDPWRSGIGAIIVINLLFTLAVPGISMAGHVGGLVGGGLAGFALFEWDKRQDSPAAAVALCSGLCVLLFAAAWWAGVNYASLPFGT